MPAKRTSAKRKPPASGLLLPYPTTTTPSAPPAKPHTRLARTPGLSETQVVHVPLANLARQTLPRYEPDDGPLTDEQMAAIRKLVAQRGFVSSKKRLF